MSDLVRKISLEPADSLTFPLFPSGDAVMIDGTIYNKNKNSWPYIMITARHPQEARTPFHRENKRWNTKMIAKDSHALNKSYLSLNFGSGTLRQLWKRRQKNLWRAHRDRPNLFVSTPHSDRWGGGMVIETLGDWAFLYEIYDHYVNCVQTEKYALHTERKSFPVSEKDLLPLLSIS